MKRLTMLFTDRSINVLLYSKCDSTNTNSNTNSNTSITSLVLFTLSSAYWQQASKLTTLVSAVSSFLMKNSAEKQTKNMSIIINIIYT